MCRSAANGLRQLLVSEEYGLQLQAGGHRLQMPSTESNLLIRSDRLGQKRADLSNALSRDLEPPGASTATAIHIAKKSTPEGHEVSISKGHGVLRALPPRSADLARLVWHHDGVRADLSESQWDSVTHGEIIGPDGAKYVRRSTKVKRRDCDDLLNSGSPLVLYYWAGGQLDWHDGDNAGSAWATARASVTTEPRSRGSLEWTAGVWLSEDGRALVLLTGHC